MSTTPEPSRPDRFNRPDGHFPSHCVSVSVPGVPYSAYYTAPGHFDSDNEAIHAAFADHPMMEVRVTRHDGKVIYDSKMKGTK